MFLFLNQIIMFMKRWSSPLQRKLDLMSILRCLLMAAQIPHLKRDWNWISIVMVSSLCIALYFRPFLSLEWSRLKLFTNYFVRFSIMAVVFSSISLASLSTLVFLGLFGKATNSSMFVSSNIFLGFFSPLQYRTWLLLVFSPLDAFFV